MKKFIFLSFVLLSSISFVSAMDLNEGNLPNSSKTISRSEQTKLDELKDIIKRDIQEALSRRSIQDPRPRSAIASDVLSNTYESPGLWERLSKYQQAELLGDSPHPSWIIDEEVGWRLYVATHLRETDKIFPQRLKEQFEQRFRNKPLYFFRVGGAGDCGPYCLQYRRRDIIADVLSCAHQDEVRRTFALEIAMNKSNCNWIDSGEPPLPLVDDFKTFILHRYGEDNQKGQLRETLDTPILLILAKIHNFSLYFWSSQKEGSRELHLVDAYFSPSASAEKHILISNGHFSNLLTSEATLEEASAAYTIEDAREAMDFPLSNCQYEDAFNMTVVSGLPTPFVQRSVEPQVEDAKALPSHHSLEGFTVEHEEQNELALQGPKEIYAKKPPRPLPFKQESEKVEENKIQRSISVPQDYTVELAAVKRIEGGYSLLAPASGPSRLWLYKNQLEAENKKPSHQKQPWKVKEGQKINVTFNIEKLELKGQLFFAIVGESYNQLQAWPITSEGPKSFSYTVQENTTGLTPLILTRESSFYLKNVVIAITD